MNLPAHGTASPDPSKHHCQLETTHQIRNNSVSAWPGPLAARRNCSRSPGGTHLPPGASALPDPTVFSSPPGGAYRAARRLLSADSLMLRRSPSGYQLTARRHTRSLQQLIIGTLTDLVPLEYYHKYLLFPFIITLGQVTQPYNNQMELFITILLCPYTPTRIPSQFFIPA